MLRDFGEERVKLPSHDVLPGHKRSSDSPGDFEGPGLDGFVFGGVGMALHGVY